MCVTFGPSGATTQAQVKGGPFEGTATGNCVASKYRALRVPPFDGDPITACKSFEIEWATPAPRPSGPVRRCGCAPGDLQCQILCVDAEPQR